MRKYIYISILLLLLATHTRAQDSRYDDTTATQIVVQPPTPADDAYDDINEPDDTLYTNNNFLPADSLAAWKGDRTFMYVRNLDSLLQLRKKEHKNEKAPDNSEGTKYITPSSGSGSGWLSGLLASNGLMVFLWVLAGAFVLFILYKLFLTGGAFKRNVTKAANAPQVAEEEAITPESDFDKMIRLALEAHNLRLAVRYQYLKALHALAAQQHIQLAADKTNYQYVHEIASESLRNGFASLTLNYEYIWYGEFTIDDMQYQKLANAFTDFNKKI